MPNERNRHGLNRHIPEAIKREIRQSCGNGCVICGRLPYHYDHFDPEFEMAFRHSADGIALLCTPHHQDKISKRLSAEAVAKARANPHNRGRSAVWSHHLVNDNLSLIIGGNRLTAPRVGCIVNGSLVLALLAPGKADGQWLLSGDLCDLEGRSTLRFRDNEVIVSEGIWDFTMEGPSLLVRTGPGEIVANLQFRPSDDEIRLERLRMRTEGGMFLTVTANKVQIDGPIVSGITLSDNEITNDQNEAFLEITLPEIGEGRIVLG